LPKGKKKTTVKVRRRLKPKKGKKGIFDWNTKRTVQGRGRGKNPPTGGKKKRVKDFTDERFVRKGTEKLGKNQKREVGGGR